MLAVGLLLIAAAASADQADIDARLPAAVMEDQFGQQHQLGDCRRLILFAPDRDSSELVQSVLSDSEHGLLADKTLCYVADISGMPALITRMFALPAMRDYGYPVILVREPDSLSTLPRRPAQVTVIDVNAGEIERIGFADNAEALRHSLQALSADSMPGGQ